MNPLWSYNITYKLYLHCFSMYIYSYLGHETEFGPNNSRRTSEKSTAMSNIPSMAHPLSKASMIRHHHLPLQTMLNADLFSSTTWTR